MSLHPLLCHAASPASCQLEIAVAVARTAAGGLRLDYRLRGEIDGLRLPAPVTPKASDGLWQHTCCEAFVAGAESGPYREFNFSPSGCWAVYGFAAYRRPDPDWQSLSSPHLEFHADAGEYRLLAEIPAALLPDDPLRLGLSLVAEHDDGAKSYWALSHAAAQPDFHLASSFSLLLP